MDPHTDYCIKRPEGYWDAMYGERDGWVIRSPVYLDGSTRLEAQDDHFTLVLGKKIKRDAVIRKVKSFIKQKISK